MARFPKEILKILQQRQTKAQKEEIQCSSRQTYEPLQKEPFNKEIVADYIFQLSDF